MAFKKISPQRCPNGRPFFSPPFRHRSFVLMIALLPTPYLVPDVEQEGPVVAPGRPADVDVEGDGGGDGDRLHQLRGRAELEAGGGVEGHAHVQSGNGFGCWKWQGNNLIWPRIKGTIKK